MHFTSSILALGFASYATAHVVITTPTPFGKSTLKNAPLLDDGSDFPCKQRTGVYDLEGASNPMALGSTQPLNFMGSAVHGGGSCQVSITYDSKPDKNSVWKVIHSIEGGCPMEGVVGNNGDNAEQPSPDTYHFTVPTGLPTGDAVLAWTWFNKVGNREMYMNCAPVTLGAGSSKRTAEEDSIVGNITQLVQRDQSFYNSLPNMFVANIGNDCGTQDSTDLIFPNAGDSVEKLGLKTSAALATPTGTGCAAAGLASSTGAAGGDASSTGAVGGDASSTGAVSGVASSTGAAGGVASSTGAAAYPTLTASPNVPNLTSASVALTSTSAPVASSTSGLPGGGFYEYPGAPSSTFVSVPVATAAPAALAALPTPIAPVESSAPPTQVASAESTASATPAAGDSVITPGTACPTQEGEWNCIGGDSFQRCGSGQWSVVQEFAAGVQCQNGVAQSIKIFDAPAAKREVHFANPHVRRHLTRSL